MYTLDDVLKRVGTGQPVKMVVRVGSHVYGTNGPDSDEDFVVVGVLATGRDLVLGKGINVTVFSEAAFKEALENQNIYALEALMAPAEHRLMPGAPYSWAKHTHRLVAEVSERSSSDFEKAIKTWNQDPMKARKRLWHSLRVPMFAQQLDKHSRITDFTVANDSFEDIMTDPCTDPSVVRHKWKGVREGLCASLGK